ncbi:MAG: DUF3782 domain-containing protein [Candidatus Lokiarchaeota archaeon]|nr:DUF3782 domain-containing protein [Candidatus Lokiarchaeota archaeon]MBD3338029.1 DUF3782 domain-containing protein [Candidatus Lokiarchaeota archaeon]
MEERFQKVDERFEAMQRTMDERFEAVIEQMNKGFDEARRDREELKVSIATISSRSGSKLEEMILNLLRDDLIQENIDKKNVTREVLKDDRGEVYYEGYTTDIDVVIQDGKTFLMEIKSTADNRDIADLLLKAKLFKIQHGKDYDGLILACLEINRVNFEKAIKQDIRVITGEIT